MGVKGLFQLISSVCKHVIKHVSVDQLDKGAIAIDASISIYQLLSAGRQIVNKRGEQINHIQGIFYRVLHLKDYGLTPIYVFDGVPPDEKQDTLDKRRAHRQIKVNERAFAEVKMLLSLMGVGYIQSVGEAEASCSRLVDKKYGVRYAGSDDIDCLVFGAPRMIKGLSIGGNKSGDVIVLELAEVIEGLGLRTHDQFIDLCILCGTDYLPTVRGVGPATALKLVREHGDIQSMLKKEVIAPSWDLAEYKQCVRLFKRPSVSLAYTVRPKDKLNRIMLEEFLIDMGMDISRIKTGTNRLFGKPVIETKDAKETKEVKP
jgi:flap endonuclease-1